MEVLIWLNIDGAVALIDRCFNPCSDGSTDLVSATREITEPLSQGFNPCSDGSTDLVSGKNLRYMLRSWFQSLF